MKKFTLLVAFGLLAACGGDDEPETKEISDPQVEMAAENTGKTSLTLTALPPGADEAAGSQAVTLVGNSITAFASQHQSFSATQAQTLKQALESPADNHDGDQIEFSYVNGRLLADINITSSPQASIRYKADLTINIQGADSTLTATIDGTLNINVTSGAEGFTSSVIYDGKFTGLKFDAAACASDPISGKITVDYDVQSGGANIPGTSLGGLVEAVFGPGCGDLTVTGT